MALQAILPFLPTIASGLGSLIQGSQDPDRQRREKLEQLLDRIESQFPKMAGALRGREAVERWGMLRRLEDWGASGGVPRNVIDQRMVQGQLGSQRNLNEALARLDQMKLGSLQNIGSLIGAMPPEPQSPWQDLFSMSLYDLISGGPMSGFLGGLGQGGGQMPGTTQLGGVGATPGALQQGFQGLPPIKPLGQF